MVVYFKVTYLFNQISATAAKRVTGGASTGEHNTDHPGWAVEMELSAVFEGEKTRIIFKFMIFVCVIGLHAVQFGNNSMKKITRTAKIGRGRRPSPILLSEEFLNFQIGQACSPVTY